MKQWEKYAGEVSKVKGQKVTLPVYDKVLLSTELVQDDQGQLREGNRVHGESEVRREGGGGEVGRFVNDPVNSRNQLAALSPVLGVNT